MIQNPAPPRTSRGSRKALSSTRMPSAAASLSRNRLQGIVVDRRRRLGVEIRLAIQPAFFQVMLGLGRDRLEAFGANFDLAFGLEEFSLGLVLRGVEDGGRFPACFLVDLFGGFLFGVEAGDGALLEGRVLLLGRTVVGFEAGFQLAFAADRIRPGWPGRPPGIRPGSVSALCRAWPEPLRGCFSAFSACCTPARAGPRAARDRREWRLAAGQG